MWFEFWIESVPLIPAIKLGAAFVLSRASSQIAQIYCGSLWSTVVLDCSCSGGLKIRSHAAAGLEMCTCTTLASHQWNYFQWERGQIRRVETDENGPESKTRDRVTRAYSSAG